jgi:hypothetical protein
MDSAKPMPLLNRSYRMKVFGLIVLVLILLGGLWFVFNISSSQWIAEARKLIAEPQPVPDYLGSLNPSPGYTGSFTDPLCFIVDEEGLFEPGNQADALSDYVVKHIQFFMDDQQIEKSKRVSQTVYGLLGNKYDDQGNFLGSYGGSIFTCYALETI